MEGNTLIDEVYFNTGRGKSSTVLLSTLKAIINYRM
jgi:hypothetical protein